MRVRSGSLVVVVAAVVLLLGGCAATNPAPTPPQEQAGAIAVRVDSVPASAAVSFRGKPVGSTPTSLRVASLDDVLGIVAEMPPQSWVEQRVEILSPTEITVLFRFGTDVGPLAKKLGLTRVLVFDYASTATFDVDSAALKPESAPILADQARLLVTAFAGVDVHVCGHTDSSGSEAHNLELSLMRAQAVAANLEGHGVARERLKVMGLAAEFPLADNETPEGKARNRRTELVLPR